MRKRLPALAGRAALVAAAAALARGAGAQEGQCPDKPAVQQAGQVLSLTRIAVDPADDRPPDPTCANRESATKTVGVQSGVTVSTTLGFTGAILGRLDGARADSAGGGGMGTGTGTNVAALGTDGMMALGAGNKRAAPRPQPSTPLTAYVMGTFQGGSGTEAPSLAGFSYGSSSGTVGLEYSVNRNLVLGLAGGFTTSNADLTTDATIDADSLQGAVYLSYATRELFVDALAAYGAAEIDTARTVQGDVMLGGTDARVFALAARGGYLFDFGKVRAGPIAGFTYLRSKVDSYTETGPANLATTVGAQRVESLTGSAGVRFLAPFQAGGSLFIPYLNVTLEHQFGDATQQLTVTLSQPGGVTLPVSFPAFDARNFGKIEGGLTIELAPDVSISLSGASTFARDDGHDYRVSAGLNYRF
jgi:uncharacterized protein YhjY with autotransporter beta-barrel domain